MRSIVPLSVDETRIYDDVTAAKRGPRRGRLLRARPRVLAAYQLYEDCVPEVGTLAKANLTATQKEALLHAFIVETKPVSELRGNLLERGGVARCPFCGISETSTLDHYLPKEHYPEFSIFAKNLVPCCAACNPLKLDRILSHGTDVRLFLHPYFDIVPDVEFLTVSARIEADALVVSYRLNCPAGMAERTFLHLQSHFGQLNLADRYRRMGLDHIGEKYPALRRAYGVNEDAARVAEELTEVAEDYEETFGKNFWLSKLYRALASDDDFCDGGFRLIRAQTTPH